MADVQYGQSCGNGRRWTQEKYFDNQNGMVFSHESCSFRLVGPFSNKMSFHENPSARPLPQLANRTGLPSDNLIFGLYRMGLGRRKHLSVISL